MKLLLLVRLVFISVHSFAQDAHYWPYRYGGRVVLMEMQ